MVSAGARILARCVSEVHDFFYPPRCWACSRKTGAPWAGGGKSLARLFCASCFAALHLAQGRECPCCGQWGVSDASLCRRCRGVVVGFRRAAAGAAYKGPVRDMVLRLKFGGMQSLAYPLARLARLGAERALEGRPVDCVVAVPLHPSRQRARGYNQAALIARHLAREMKIPFLSGGVRRVRATDPQGAGGGGSRRENVRDAFAPVESRAASWFKGEVPGARLAGLHVLLVDDVLSTGATLDHCGRALLAAKVASVTAAVAAT